ncbi:hypothetical protein BDB01DRAFT_549656 [Pilobolus umbonatus]|nr:hypothetical protein BDB01DRAFT_549656 [Pilobolus umbonatus]
MNVRSENLQFLWNPITQVLPNMNRELCRRKFHNMLGMYPVLRETVEELKELWRKFYKQGLELGELKDDQPWNTKEYDLKSYTEYFITKLDKEGYIYNNFKLNNPRLEGLNVKSLKRASTQQIAFRYMNKFNLPAGIDVYDVQNVLMLVASQAIKISCMIQEENYNSAEAYCFLKQFPDKILKKAYEMLKKEGVLVNDRYSRVPGRLINISEK